MAQDPIEPPDTLTSSVTREAWRYWHALRGERPLPARSDLNPASIIGILPHVMLIEVLEDPIDFRYRLIGTYIDERLSQRYTGRRAREFADKGPGSRLWEQLCRVVEERRPVVSTLRYTGPDQRFKAAEEVMLPLVDERDRITTIFDALVFLSEERASDPVTGRV